MFFVSPEKLEIWTYLVIAPGPSIIRVKTKEELKECFEYELSPIPLSLFDESGQMRKSKKSILYDVFLI